MNMIYTKRAFAFISVLIMLFSMINGVFAISEQGLPGEVGDTGRAGGDDRDEMFGGGDTTTTPIMPRQDVGGGDNTTDLPDGDGGTTAAPSTTRAPSTTSAENSTGEAAMNGIWILVIIIALAAVAAVAIAALMKRK